MSKLYKFLFWLSWMGIIAFIAPMIIAVFTENTPFLVNISISGVIVLIFSLIIMTFLE